MSTNGAECTRSFSHGITQLQSSKSGTLAVIVELTSRTSTTNITQGLSWAWRVVNRRRRLPKPIRHRTVRVNRRSCY
jgi:hypothetical protein